MLAALGDIRSLFSITKMFYRLPNQFHSQVVLPLVNQTRMFYNTVIKHITKDESDRWIIQIDAI